MADGFSTISGGIKMNALSTIEPTRPQLWLNVPKGQSFEEWVSTGEQLCRTDRVLNWWIGDWWAAGHHRYGERAKVAAEGIFGLEFKTLANAASVCRAFETSRRREHLSWSHHLEVAALPPAEADTILDNAEQLAWTKKDVRRAVTGWKVETGLIIPQERDDPEDDEFVAAAQAFNKWSLPLRLLILQSIEEMGAITIADESLIRNIRL